MSGIELNKIAASILIAGLVMMITGKIASTLYHPTEALTRGYSVDESAMVTDTAGGAGDDSAEPVTIDIRPLLASADAASGQTVAKKCLACHTFDKGGIDKVGPNLWGIIGASVAHSDSFNYSGAMKDYGGTWDYNRLATYLYDPKKAVKGTKMAFAGLRKEKDIADLLAYLRQQSDNPIPLP